jgi:heme-degrading monooxygenase HmoA
MLAGGRDPLCGRVRPARSRIGALRWRFGRRSVASLVRRSGGRFARRHEGARLRVVDGQRDDMITEIADIEIKPGMESEFEAAVKKATPLFHRAKGCRGMELQRSIEKPSRYRLFVSWETLENHTVDFRDSPDFQEWRKLVGHCFASPPQVEHANQVVKL